MLIKSYLIT